MSVELDVIAFDDPLPPDIDAVPLLGGKGAGLVEMTQALGLPIPPGFIITTTVCQHYLASGWTPDLKARITQQLERLGQKLGCHFGDPLTPLLVSVRSGAPVSMPGMMDTLLNVGMTPDIQNQLAIESGAPLFAADTWLRFCRLYAEMVLGVPRADLLALTQVEPTPAALLQAADGIRQLATQYGGIPLNPMDQLWNAIDAVIQSWNSERAQTFRKREHLPDHLGTAVTIQAMVFGNLDDQSGSGVVFTRNPSTGAPEAFGDYLAQSQGEDVVAGSHAVLGLSTLQHQLPFVYDRLLDSLRTLERHYRDLCEVEFTVSAGQLYFLQTRIGRRSPLASIRIAVDMAEAPNFPLTRDEAVSRVDFDTLPQLSQSGSVTSESIPIGTGLAVSPGVGVGILSCNPERAAELSARGQAVILARSETSPSDIHGMVGAAGLLTTLGGVASHAAVVARSWGIPAVTSLTNASVHPTYLQVGEVIIAEGATVTVDGNTGAVYQGNQRQTDSTDIPQISTLRRWALEVDGKPEPLTTPAQTPPRRHNASLMELLRTLQLKGLCSVDIIANLLATTEERLLRFVADHPSLFRETPRGLALTADGRDWVTEQIRSERATLDTSEVDTMYTTHFLPLNTKFKQLVSDWQVRSATNAAADDWEVVGEALTSLHTAFRPLVDDIAAHLSRLSTYGPRFDTALTAIQDGDRSMLASPLKDSYHTVWFEFHEELIDLCGRNRAEEENQ